MCRPIGVTTTPLPLPEVLPSDDGTCTIAEYYRLRLDAQAADIDAIQHYNDHGRNEGMCRLVADDTTPMPPTDPTGPIRMLSELSSLVSSDLMITMGRNL